MRRTKTWLCLLTMMFVSMVFSGAISSRGQSPNITYDELKKTNVSLEFVGYDFASGLVADAKGQPNWNGVQLTENRWAGSGFIVKNDGTIITNYHVARRARAGQARFEGGASYKITQIKAYDVAHDIAILRISTQDPLPTVRLGNSDAVNVMDKVLAVGNAFDQNMAVTDGIINQVFTDDNNARYRFRHSATIAPGNSGGALYKGNEVIGINVSIKPPYNIQFAIPVNLAKPLLNDPKYTWVPFDLAFPVDPEAIGQRAKQIFAQNDRVPAADGKNPGLKGYALDVYPLEDLMFIVQSQGEKLALAALEPDQGKPLGLSNLGQPNCMLLFNEYLNKIVVYVMNYGETPANFALTAYNIVW